jgi:radical SAM protein with 4Fe4S-binding SPASM domain
VSAFTRTDTPDLVSELLNKYKIQELRGYEIKPYANGHDRMISSRKWSYQNWLGCPMNVSIFDELMPMGLAGQFVEQVKPQTLVCFSPEMPFFLPEAVEKMISVSGDYFEDFYLELLAMFVPMGVSPIVISSRALDSLKANSVWLPKDFFATTATTYTIKVRSALNFPKFDNDRRNFLLRSERDHRRLKKWNGIFDELDPDEGQPKEIQLEVTSIPHHENCRLPKLPSQPDMTLRMIKNILADAREVRDLLLTIGDLGSLAHYVHLDELRTLLIKERPYGVHVIFDAQAVFDDIVYYGEWFTSGFDIITIRLTSLGKTPQELEKYKEQIKLITELYVQSNINTVLNFELHKYHDNWRMIETLQAWVDEFKIAFSWTSNNDYAGQVNTEIPLPVYAPKKCGPCQKILNQLHILPDGSVTPCRQDFSGKSVWGNITRNSLQEIWDNEHFSKARDLTNKNPREVTTLCNSCHQSFYV